MLGFEFDLMVLEDLEQYSILDRIGLEVPMDQLDLEDLLVVPVDLLDLVLRIGKQDFEEQSLEDQDHVD